MAVKIKSKVAPKQAGPVVAPTVEKGSKKIVANKASTKGLYLSYGKEVDQITKLRAELEANALAQSDKIKELNALEGKLKEVAKTLPAEVAGTFIGTKTVFVVSEKQMNRTITDIKDVRKAMGDEVFMECAKITLTDIDKYLTKEQVAKLTVLGRTGNRTTKIVPKQ